MIARKAMLIFTVSTIGYFLSFIALIFVGRFLGPIPLGIIGFASGFVGLFSFLAYFGFDTAHIKRISEGKDLGKCVGTYLSVKIILAIITIIVVISSVYLWKIILNGEFESQTHEIVLYIILVSVVITNLSNIMLSTFAGLKETAKQQIPLFIGHITQSVSRIIVAVLSLSVFFLAGAYVLGAISTFIFALFLFRKYPIKKPSKEYFYNYRIFAFPIIFGVIGSTIIANFDRVMIQFFLGTQQVGLYFTAENLIMFCMFLGHGLLTVLIPTISSFSINGNEESIRLVVSQSERYISMITTPFLAFTFLFSYPLINVILGETFASAYMVLSIYSVIMWIKITIIPISAEICGIDKPKIFGKVYIVIVIVNIIFNFLLIPDQISGIPLPGLGIEGAAIATLISFLIQMILYRFIIFKLTRTKPNPKIILHLLSAFIMSLILYFIYKILIIKDWYYLLALALFGLFIYYVFLYLIKEFTLNDFKFFKLILSKKKMIEYIKNEL